VPKGAGALLTTHHWCLLWTKCARATLKTDFCELKRAPMMSCSSTAWRLRLHASDARRHRAATESTTLLIVTAQPITNRISVPSSRSASYTCHMSSCSAAPQIYRTHNSLLGALVVERANCHKVNSKCNIMGTLDRRYYRTRGDPPSCGELISRALPSAQKLGNLKTDD
jgi:hypothetical protein